MKPATAAHALEQESHQLNEAVSRFKIIRALEHRAPALLS